MTILGARKVHNPLVRFLAPAGRPVHRFAETGQQQFEQFGAPLLQHLVLGRRMGETDSGFPNVFAAIDMGKFFGFVRTGAAGAGNDCEIGAKQ